MSAEHFQTVLTADMRTAPDGRGIEYAPSMTETPRWLNDDGTINRPSDGTRTWMCGYLYAHNAVDVAANTVASDPMDGISGDLPEHREQAAAVLRAAARLVRYLACDDAYDGTVTAEGWRKHLDAVREAAA